MRTLRMWWRCTRRVARKFAAKILTTGFSEEHGETQGKAPDAARGSKKEAGRWRAGRGAGPSTARITTRLQLELVPKVLVVYIVVVLHFGRFHERAQQAGTAIGRCLLQIGVAALHVLAQQLRSPVCLAKVVERLVDIIRQVAFGLAQVLDLRRAAIESSLED